MRMTDNEPAVVDEQAFTVRRTIRIAAAVEKVWSAVTEPAHISEWFGRVALDGSGAGAAGTITWDGVPPIPLRVEAIEPHRMVAYRWGNDGSSGERPAAVDPDHSTVFTFTLEPVDGGTQLTVVETGFETTADPVAELDDHRDGWNHELDKLVALLEGAG